MDDTEQGEAGQLITILSIWRDPSSDIGLNPRNNWCMQSQIGSPPKIWSIISLDEATFLVPKLFVCPTQKFKSC